MGARGDILRGTAQVLDPAALLTRIEAEIEQQLATLYLGTEKKITWDGALDVRTIAAGTLIPVLRIDPENGICLASWSLRPMPSPSRVSLIF